MFPGPDALNRLEQIRVWVDRGWPRDVTGEQWTALMIDLGEIRDELRLTSARPMLRTDADIEHLKRSWLADPCWDIEDTEGFEAHRHELTAFRFRNELEWRKQQEAGAERLGVTPLGRSMILDLEQRVAALEAARG